MDFTRCYLQSKTKQTKKLSKQPKKLPAGRAPAGTWAARRLPAALQGEHIWAGGDRLLFHWIKILVEI